MNVKKVRNIPVHSGEEKTDAVTTGSFYTCPGHGKLIKYVGVDYHEPFIHIVDVSFKEANDLMKSDTAFVFDHEASLLIRKAYRHLEAVCNRRTRKAARQKEKARRKVLKERSGNDRCYSTF